MVTALTVGYGDAPAAVCCFGDSPAPLCENSTLVDGGVALTSGIIASGSGEASVPIDILGATVDNPCGYKSIRDSYGDMIFVMLYATLMVTVALSMLTEFLEALEIEQRKRESKAQRIMLEAYFEGQIVDEGIIARAVTLSADDTESNAGSLHDDWPNAPTKCETCLGYLNNRPILKALVVHFFIMIIGIIWFAYYYDEHWIDSAYWVVITGLAVGP